jgi:hypothetical protein
MALASTTWDDYPTGRAALSPRLRRNLFSALAACVAAAACLAVAVLILHALEDMGLIARIASPARVTLERSYPLSKALRPFERSADTFLKDSLLLTQRCAPGCIAITSDIAEAKNLGRFVAAGSLPTGLPLHQRFSLPAAPEFAVAETSPAPLPAPIRVIPSVVVPLSPATFDNTAAPVPAPRLARSEKLAAPAAMVEQMEQASLPAPARVASPASSPVIGRNDGVAIYDISAATVYMPNGERLEAHSGLGYMVDNPRYVDRRNTGPTPPNTYNLVGLNDLFYGVEALRLVPVDDGKMYGRDGFLTHTYLLRGHPAESNGCVAFKDYARFLAAYKRGYVKRLIVVPSLANSPLRVASADDGKSSSSTN